MSALPKLPPFIASNMTDEEFLKLLDRSDCPPYVRERFIAIIESENDDLEQAHSELEDEKKENAQLTADIEKIGEATEAIRENWDKLLRVLNPENGAVSAITAAIKIIEAVE